VHQPPSHHNVVVADSLLSHTSCTSKKVATTPSQYLATKLFIIIIAFFKRCEGREGDRKEHRQRNKGIKKKELYFYTCE
jgi:hypothetical protein